MPERSAVRLFLAALAAALLLAACSDRVPAPATPTATRTPRPATPTAVRTPPPEVPDFLEGVEVRPLRFERDASVTNMTNLIVELGCTQCDGPTTGFARVYGTPYGGVRFDVLLTPEMLPLPSASGNDQRFIAGFGFAPDGSDLIAGVCVRGDCGWLGVPSPDDEVWLFRSTDGGITWTDYGRLPRAEFVLGWLGPGSVLTSFYEAASETFSHTARPSGETVRPPVNVPDAAPVVTPTGELLWRAGDSLLIYPDGKIYAQAEQAGVTFFEPVAGTDSAVLPLHWDNNGTLRYYLAELEPEGSVRRALTSTSWINPEAWMSPIGGDRLFATVNVPADRYSFQTAGPFAGTLPAVIDLGSGTIMPIPEPFSTPPFLNGRNHIVAVQQGPLLPVNGTGDCLNIRDSTSLNANVLACAADGVLLRDSGDRVAEGGVTWARVTTPAGAEGWAATQYLELRFQ